MSFRFQEKQLHFNTAPATIFTKLPAAIQKIVITVPHVVVRRDTYYQILRAFKRECPRRPREMIKMWHMLEKSISFIFRSEIPHDELLIAVYSFCSDLLLFSRKFAKTVQDADHYKNGGH